MVPTPSHPCGALRRGRVLAAAVAATLLAPAGPALSQVASATGAPRAASAPERADPLDAQAVVPPAQHRSALTAYRRMSEQPVGDWRAANDLVTKIGGWRAYAREADDASGETRPGAPAGAAPK